MDGQAQNPNDDLTPIILAGKQGDRAALTKLIEHFAPSVHRLIYSIVRDSGLVEDLAQETFVKMLMAFEHYEFRAPFRSWLMRIAVNTCRDHLRKKKVRSIMSYFKTNEDTDEQQSFVDDAPDPSTVLDKHERQEILMNALQKLSETSRMILVLRELEQLSYEEIVQILGWKMGTVKSRLFRARQELLEALLPHREDLI